MPIKNANRKIKRSFTLTPDAAKFITESRRRRKSRSDSEALDLLLRELMTEANRQEIDAACKTYYDEASDEELAEQREWANQTSQNMWIGVPE